MLRVAVLVSLLGACLVGNVWAAPYKVMIVTWAGCEEACEGVQRHFRDQGIEARFLLRSADGKREALAPLLAEARAEHVDLIVTHGTNATLGIAGRLSDPGRADLAPSIPKVFMIVADPVGSGLVKSLDEPGRPDLTGTYNRVPERVNIETLRLYRSQFRKLGLLFHADERNSVLKRDELAALTSTLGFELVARELPLGRDGRPNVAGILPGMKALKAAGVDFVYVGSSTFLREHGKLLADAAAGEGLAVLSPYESMAREGHALLSIAARYADVGRLAGEQAEKILRSGKPAGTLAVARMTRFAIVVNLQVARGLKLFPPLDLLQVSETVN